MVIANTIAYYYTATITSLKSFIVWTLDKSFNARYNKFFNTPFCATKLECFAVENIYGTGPRIPRISMLQK